MPLSQKNTPEILVIYGKIGCGKSTLISSIVNELTFKETRNIQKKIQILPIVINVRERFRKDIVEILKDENINSNDIENILRKRLLLIIKESFLMNNITPQHNGETISDLLIPAYKKLVRPLVILDELDVVYYEFCKANLSPSSITQPDINKFKEIVRFFVDFPENEAIRGLYQSVLFIISLRESSYTLFNSSNLVGAQMDDAHAHRIKLQMNNNAQIKKIFLQRLSLKLDWLMRHSSETPETIEVIQSTIHKLKTDQIDFTQNIILSVHGLRHLMNLFHKIDSFDPSSKLLCNFLTNPNDLLLIYQFLDGALDYSQTNEGVSNIYLVNKDYKSLSNPLLPRLKQIHEGFLCDHLQTYYLKYYILLLVYKKDRIDNEPLFPGEIKSIFCSKLKNERSTIYEDEIVSLILLHATETDHGRLIRLDTFEKGGEVKCRCTARAAEMIEKNIFWKFKYLLVIIEDHWLGFPTCLKDEFKITADWMKSFQFVTNFNALNHEEKIRFIKYKAKLTLIFLILLDVAAKYEQQMYGTAISNLRRYLGQDVILPKMNDKIIILKDDIILFSKKLIDESHIPIIQKYIDIELTERILPTYKKKLDAHYCKYHTKMNIHSIPDMMDKYHTERYG